MIYDQPTDGNATSGDSNLFYDYGFLIDAISSWVSSSGKVDVLEFDQVALRTALPNDAARSRSRLRQGREQS